MSICSCLFKENQFVLSHERDVSCEMFHGEGRGLGEDCERRSGILTMTGEY